ncbi:maleylpyruvate isomerase family mycothiol-dependent enzyme [Kitasatospora sp. NPDC051853]|uniref:maleylpyruvate isomerase family mycothiol-dependent enzyme n=1 Tax=Kitasatospora sp. NPDC051853 TaxID=3364058 RepID=UPI0037AEC354
MTDTTDNAAAAAARAARDLKAVEESTATLLRVAAELSPEQVPQPSALPGWTRGHVLAHLSRNADSLVNLLDNASTGSDTPQYPSSEAREQGIENDAPRPLAEQWDDLRASHRRFAEAAARLTEQDWSAPLKHRFGYVFPAHELPWKRLMEVEYHLVDLAAGYTPADWPLAFATAELPRLAAQFEKSDGLPELRLTATDTGAAVVLAGDADAPVTVEGPVRELVAWLSGRGDGSTLSASAPLPTLPAMG